VNLYRMVTGKLPFDGANEYEVFMAVLEKEAELPAEAPPPIRAIIDKALKKKPAERYATAAAMGADLDAFLRDNPASSGAVADLMEVSFPSKSDPERKRLSQWPSA
jgi:serine/threonine protein kinase